MIDVSRIQVVTIERKRRMSNAWGLAPLLLERKTIKAIYIPFSEHPSIVAPE